MSDSFGGVNFTILYDGRGHSVVNEITIIHIPYSNNNQAQLGGRTEHRYPYHILLASMSDYNSLWALMGTTAGTLVSHLHGTIPTAALASIDQEEVTPKGKVFARANFISVT